MLSTILLSILLSSSTAAVSVTSCCPSHQTLDLSTPDLPQCVTSGEGEVGVGVPGESVGTLCLFEFGHQEILLRWGLREGLKWRVF